MRNSKMLKRRSIERLDAFSHARLQCSLMRFLCQKAVKTGYLSHFERLTLLYVFGHLGDDGKEFVHTIMKFTLNYRYHVTERFIRKLPERPISCVKLRDQYKQVTAEIGCSCVFQRNKNCYPSPVLHAISLSSNAKSDVTLPTSRSLSKEKEDKIKTEMNVHVKVQDLAKRILEYKKQKRTIDKSVKKTEAELSAIFDEQGVDCMEIDMGLLTRRQHDGEVEWVIEI